MSTLLEAFPLPPGKSKITYSRGSNPPQPGTMFSFQTLPSHTDCTLQLIELFVLSSFWVSQTLLMLLSVFSALNQDIHSLIPQRYVSYNIIYGVSALDEAEEGGVVKAVWFHISKPGS